VLDACHYSVSESRPYPAGTFLCLNNGTCQASHDVAGVYTCLCQSGFTGTRCETDLLTTATLYGTLHAKTQTVHDEQDKSLQNYAKIVLITPRSVDIG